MVVEFILMRVVKFIILQVVDQWMFLKKMLLCLPPLILSDEGSRSSSKLRFLIRTYMCMGEENQCMKMEGN